MTICFTTNNNESTNSLSYKWPLFHSIPLCSALFFASPFLFAAPLSLPFASFVQPPSCFRFRLSKLARLDQLRHAPTCLSPVKLLILASSWHLQRTWPQANSRLSPSSCLCCVINDRATKFKQLKSN